MANIKTDVLDGKDYIQMSIWLISMGFCAPDNPLTVFVNPRKLSTSLLFIKKYSAL
jgi:hypothetical protein